VEKKEGDVKEDRQKTKYCSSYEGKVFKGEKGRQMVNTCIALETETILLTGGGGGWVDVNPNRDPCDWLKDPCTFTPYTYI
jgi:hypothetical protein